MKCSRVAVLRGGPSSEYSVSLETGRGVLTALEGDVCTVRDIIIDRKGDWYVAGFPRTPSEALCDIDVVFIALHGEYGEDGTVQRLLDGLGIPYTGSGAYASAVAMNKALTKDILRSHNIKMPRHVRVTRETVREVRQTAENIERMFGPHYVVKPVNGGSSLHTELAQGFAELSHSLDRVLNEVEVALVEERIFGREVTVPILEQYRNHKHYPLPVVEIVPPSSASFFDAKVKYDGSTEEICPGRFSESEKDELQKAAMLVHQVLDLRHYSRSDFIMTDAGPYFLEVNTLPGLTAESLFPKAIAAIGGNYRELVKHLLELATNRSS